MRVFVILLCLFGSIAVSQQTIPYSKDLLNKAKSGNLDAQYQIGIAYYLGSGTKANSKKATFWLKIAADNGSPIAAANLALMYQRHQGIPDEVGFDPWYEAHNYYLKAAQGNFTPAFYPLAQSFEMGYQAGILFRKPDYDDAIMWYRRAADHNENPAEYALGRIYENGLGVPQNPALAVKWYMKAAQDGSADAKTRLELISEQNAK